jgi:hypothetical protein
MVKYMTTECRMSKRPSEDQRYSVPMTTRTAFVSGPLVPPPTYFSTYYEPLLLPAIAAGDSFIMGPAPGIDTIALRFLISRGVSPSKITVYLTEYEDQVLRSALKWFEDLGGNIEVEGIVTGDRDAAMTRDSDYDVLRYMSMEEQKTEYGEMYYPRVSATEKNERRRLGLPLHVNYALDH